MAGGSWNANVGGELPQLHSQWSLFGRRAYYHQASNEVFAGPPPIDVRCVF